MTCLSNSLFRSLSLTHSLSQFLLVSSMLVFIISLFHLLFAPLFLPNTHACTSEPAKEATSKPKLKPVHTGQTKNVERKRATNKGKTKTKDERTKKKLIEIQVEQQHMEPLALVVLFLKSYSQVLVKIQIIPFVPSNIVA